MALQDSATPVSLTDRTGFMAQKVGTLFLHEVERRLADSGLGTRSYFVLAGIDRAAPVSQQDLSRLLGIDPTTIVALVDELERARFVRRSRNPRDRRRNDLTLTAAGERSLAAAHEAMDAAEREFFAPLNDSQRRRYDDALERLLAGRWPPPAD